jgi:hypothetical protein
VRYSISFRVYSFLYLNAHLLTIVTRYKKKLKRLIIKNLKLKIKYRDSHTLATQRRIFTLSEYTTVYNFFFFTTTHNLFYLLKGTMSKKPQTLYYVLMSFYSNRFYVNLHNFFKKNYIGISTGLFIKFFEKKKSMKKNKLIKFLMSKFLRKLIIILNLKNLILIFKKTPVFLIEILNFLNQPLPHKFNNPLENKIINETLNFAPHLIKFLYFIFLQNYSFSKNKTRRKGRVKRKVYRKLILTNQVID